VKRGRLLATGALALVMVALALYGGGNLVRVWQMEREVNALEHELQRVRAETDCLTRTVDRLREDPAQIEKLAREELGYVKKGEKVLKFPSAPATPERTC
jgi:cell division protein FtsB